MAYFTIRGGDAAKKQCLRRFVRMHKKAALLGNLFRGLFCAQGPAFQIAGGAQECDLTAFQFEGDIL